MSICSQTCPGYGGAARRHQMITPPRFASCQTGNLRSAAIRSGIFLLCMTFSLFAVAGGAWQDSNGGTTLTYRGVVTSSSPLKARDDAQGEITLVAWRYVLSAPAPAGLLVRLCSPARCVALEGERGATRGLTGVAASEPLRFVYEVPGGGRLFPLMRVVSNEAIVNYRY